MKFFNFLSLIFDSVFRFCFRFRFRDSVSVSGFRISCFSAAHILRSAQDSLRSLVTRKKESWVFNYTGCRGRPPFHIPQDMLQLYLDYQFSLAKIGQIFGVSSKTIQRRITEYDLKKVDLTNVSDKSDVSYQVYLVSSVFSYIAESVCDLPLNFIVD